MNGSNMQGSDDAREYVLAEFRCAWAKAKLAQHDIEAVALALKSRIVSADQAVAMFWDSDAIRFLGIGCEAFLAAPVTSSAHEVQT